jgi:hypothetical protein
MIFNTTRDNFFNIINTKEINKQLNLLYVPDGTNMYRTTQVVMHDLAERRQVA